MGQSRAAEHEHFDVVVVGGGHNGLVAATYLAKAGRSVVVLERQDQVGGAAVSAEAFPGTGAQLSRYSYLVSLIPAQVIDDLGLNIELVRRRYSSYTPLPGGESGLLVDNDDRKATRKSFKRVGAGQDAAGFAEFYGRTSMLAEKVWPTVTAPLMRRSEMRSLIGDDDIWTDFIEQPLGHVVERAVESDLARGVILTDGLISTFARAHDEDLQQNKCFLYHVIGGGTGDWDVPVGGMGAVSGALEAAARAAGVVIRTGADVTAVAPNGVVHYTQQRDDDGGASSSVNGEFVLANVTPAVLGRLMGGPGASGFAPSSHPDAEGAQVKVNLLLSRLPRLLDPEVTAEQAFGGTFHINELYSQLDTAYSESAAGRIPSPLPIEIYCHSLADPSILSTELRDSGAHTLTVFSLQTPHRLVAGGVSRDELQAAVLESLNSVLAEPIEDCILRDPSGALCIETKTTLDLEEALGLTGGNIFHGPLSWPFAEDDEPLDTPAQRWGVATDHPRILLCGAGSRRGGGVSGLGGHSAAMALLDSEPCTG